MSDQVPVIDVDELTANGWSDDNKRIIEELKIAYEEKFKDTPEFYVRAPGRVNLIGEHMDYNGYSSIPIAIDKSILVAVGSNSENKISIYNIDCNYEPITISFQDLPKQADTQNLRWHDYIKAGLLHICQKYDVNDLALNLVVGSSLPAAAGLSSSSALVCAAAIAVAVKYRLQERMYLDKKSLSSICAESERYVGTKGGCMDHTTIFLAEEGYGLHIQYQPLKCENIPLPDNLTFIVAHSGVKAEKAVTNDFNTRVFECQIAARILAKERGVPWRNDIVLFTLQIKPLEYFKYVENHIIRDDHSAKEVCTYLEISIDEFKEFANNYNIEDVDETTNFKILPRVKHVMNESNHIIRFIDACKDENLVEIGRLLTESHTSLKENYDVSHEKLDELVEFSIQSGALGARLTGAGFGGAIIIGARKEDAVEIETKLKAYAAEKGQDESLVFVAKPAGGATVIRNVVVIED